jgi:hypothetical protein
MLLLSLFRFFASHPHFLIAAVVIYVFSFRQIFQDVQPCNSTIPDFMFGYSDQQLNSLYEKWGRDGRQAYVKGANTDLFPCMEAYTILLGAFLVVASDRLRWKNDRIAYAAVAVMLLDLVETLIQRHGSQVYPEKLSPNMIWLGSVCNQAKWALLVGCVAVVMGSFVFGRKSSESSRRKRSTATMQRRTRARRVSAEALSPPTTPRPAHPATKKVVILGMEGMLLNIK